MSDTKDAIDDDDTDDEYQIQRSKAVPSMRKRSNQEVVQLFRTASEKTSRGEVRDSCCDQTG